jgi:putative SOS response-associated peptidase YedK
MCGRIALIEPPERLARLAAAVCDWPDQRPWTPSWDVPPTAIVPLLLIDRATSLSVSRSEPAPDGPTTVATPPNRPDVPRRRVLRPAHWGLVPSWASNRSIGARLFNARAETVGTKPAFRAAARARRAVVPVAGFYEWAAVPGRRRRVPWFFDRSDGRLLGLAALFETWRDPAAAPSAPTLLTCTVVTTAAGPDVGAVHDRMPVVLEPEDWDRWLDPATDRLADVADLLAPAPAGTLRGLRRAPSEAS